ncbi:carbamoyltransferase N-terminal domain-containing protein, partial [Vibrio parahaemolyticus]
LEEEVRYPHSLGLFYSAIAEHVGFSAVGGEGKLMGLAAYGKPTRIAEL